MNSRRAILALVAVSLWAAGALAQSPRQQETAEPPKVIWEKEFPFRYEIQAVGVDEEHYASTGNIEASLRWLLAGNRMYRFWWRGKFLMGPAIGLVDPRSVSAEGRYFLASFSVGRFRQRWWAPWRGIYCRAFRPGRLDKWILRWDHFSLGLVRDDGSAVLAALSGGCEPDIEALYFLDQQGIPKTIVQLSSDHGPELLSVNISEDYFVMNTYARGIGAKVCLFNIGGNLIWERDIGEGRVEVTVSDSGDVLATIDRGSVGSAAFVFDRCGVARDSFQLPPYVLCRSLATDGRLMFIVKGTRGATRPPAEDGLICYGLNA